jgi:ankyrin repeat protein
MPRIFAKRLDDIQIFNFQMDAPGSIQSRGEPARQSTGTPPRRPMPPAPPRETELTRFSPILAFVLLLLAFGPQTAFGQAMTETRLHAAAARDDVAAIKRLLAEGAAINARDERGRTALLAATHENRVNAARALIEAGADVNAKDAMNDSPYLYAGARGHLAILKLTLEHGADLKSTNRYGGTALIPACERGHVETVRTLIAAGVKIDHINNLGWTGLLEAIILSDGGEKHQQIVKDLLAAGADVNLADRDGVTPLQHARSRGQAKMQQILLAAGGR